MILILATPLFAISEFTTVKQPNEEEKIVIEGLQQDITATEADITTYYTDMKERGRISADGMTELPLNVQVLGSYGRREKYLFNESASIKWNGEKIESFAFDLRKGEIGTVNVLKKRITYRANQGQNTVNMIVIEYLSSGQGQKVSFRFPTATETDVRDRVEEVELNGIKHQMQVIFIRDVPTRITMLRENLRLLKLLKRRLDWTIRSENARNEREVERLLKID